MEKINSANGINAVISNKQTGERPSFLSEKEVSNVRKFHSSIVGYKATPLVSLEEI